MKKISNSIRIGMVPRQEFIPGVGEKQSSFKVQDQVYE